MFEGVEHIKVSAEEQEGCQCSRADTIALCQRLGGVTYTVECISDVAHRLGLSTHLGDTTGIVGDGTESIHGENIRGTHEHTHGGDSSTKDTTRVDDLWNDRRVNAYLATQEEREEQGDADCQYRQSNAFEADSDTGDDGCSGASQGCRGNFTYRTPCTSGIVLRDVYESDAQENTYGTCQAEPDPGWYAVGRRDIIPIQQEKADNEHADNRETAGYEVADIELMHGDYAWIFPGGFIWLGDDRGTNPE